MDLVTGEKGRCALKRAFEVAAIAAVLACVARTASPRSSADVQAVPANTTQALERAIEHGLTVFTHGGAVSGFIARNTFIPQTRSAVVVVISDDGGPLANAIVERALSVAMPARAANLPVTTGPSAAREDRGEIPRVSGPEPGTTASALFKALQAGTLDRSGLSEEYNVFVTDAKARDASRALKPFGAPTGVSV